MSARKTLPISINYKVKETLKDIKEHRWLKQLVLIVKSSTSKRLLSFYTPNILNGLLITPGELKVLGKITQLIVLFKAKFMDLDILIDTIYTFNCTFIIKDYT